MHIYISKACEDREIADIDSVAFREIFEIMKEVNYAGTNSVR